MVALRFSCSFPSITTGQEVAKRYFPQGLEVRSCLWYVIVFVFMTRRVLLLFLVNPQRPSLVIFVVVCHPSLIHLRNLHSFQSIHPPNNRRSCPEQGLVQAFGGFQEEGRQEGQGRCQARQKGRSQEEARHQEEDGYQEDHHGQKDDYQEEDYNQEEAGCRQEDHCQEARREKGDCQEGYQEEGRSQEEGTPAFCVCDLCCIMGTLITFY